MAGINILNWESMMRAAYNNWPLHYLLPYAYTLELLIWSSY